ncbi:MAG: hypothetical protein EXX96DRAFT_132021 [Benjaminiella poitrasii]|nr:MAG: hypothetical protein EXX96DRAFT_132021 [Benjaminiella poitrasii]
MKTVLIVGGGFAGTHLSKSLEKALFKLNDEEHRIILIEKKSHFYHCIGGLRTIVDSEWDKHILIPYTNLFSNKKNQVIQATAVQLERDRVIIDKQTSTDEILFDYLVIATGTDYPFPSKASALDYHTTRQKLDTLRSHVKSAESIAIIGGGPVGIELAGELHDAYANTKKITIVHDKANFLDDASNPSPKLRQKLLQLAQKNQIHTVFNAHVVLPPVDQISNASFYVPEERQIQTREGKTIEDVDLVLLAFGNRPQTGWLKTSEFGRALLNPENGYVKVTSGLQVEHEDAGHIFVLGDAADLKETKMAFRISAHASVVVQNLIQQITRQNGKPAVYQKGHDGMLITFGKKQGVGILPIFGGITVGDWFVSSLKGKSFLVGKSWSILNEKEPSNENKN